MFGSWKSGFLSTDLVTHHDRARDADSGRDRKLRVGPGDGQTPSVLWCYTTAAHRL